MAGVEFIRVTPGKTRRVMITADTRILGQHVSAGKMIEVAEEQAHQLVIASKAEFVSEKGK